MSFEIQYDAEGYPKNNAANAAIKQKIETEHAAFEQAPPLVREAQQEAAPEQESSVLEDLMEPKQEVQEEIVEKKYKPTPQESIAALKKKAERMERERDEALMKAQQYEQQRPKESAPVEEEDIDIADNDLAEGKHLKKLKREVKQLKVQLQQNLEQSNASMIETKLRSTFTDFDSVVTKENVEMLRDMEPELASTLASSKDMYATAVSAYKMIKRLGINQNHYDAEKEVAQKNAAKPRPLTSISPQQGESPLSKANAFAQGLTPELEKKLWQEMNEARKKY